MRLPIRHWPDPVLLRPCQSWTWGTGQETLLEKCLLDTLAAENALGLAANQIGYDVRVLAMRRQAFGDVVVMYNPEIIEQSTDTELGSEGCLSFPRIELDIPRSRTVTVAWQCHNQYRHSVTLSGIDARCFLHELDHLNGRVFKEYVSELKFQRAARRVLPKN